MEEQCLVLSGDWVCGHGGKWDFVVEKNRWGRMVPVYEGISCLELESNVLREFKVDEARFGVSLSYWPPSSLELATGIKTPPVLITSDGAVKYFCQHLKVKGGMNLFARFEMKPQAVDTDIVDDSGIGFVSPDAAKFSSGSSKKGYMSSGASKTKIVNLADAEFLREVEGVEGQKQGVKRTSLGVTSNGGGGSGYSNGTEAGGFVSPFSSGSSKKCYMSSAASKRKVVHVDDDDDFVREVEELEGKMFGGKRKEETSNGVEGSAYTNETEGEGSVEADLDEIEVRPRGYDREFWSPLLAGDYCGSNAVDVLFNEDEIVEGLTKKTGPRTYFCNIGSCFDHHVEVGGDGGGEPKPNIPKPEDYNPWMGGGYDGSGGDNGNGGQSRRLDDIDDEEFDIPPMFDDTEYDSAEIPDMDVDEHDGQIAVGKVFESKEDCRIALAIYAIKKQFKFKQTRTKIDYFVVECPADLVI